MLKVDTLFGPLFIFLMVVLMAVDLYVLYMGISYSRSRAHGTLNSTRSMYDICGMNFHHCILFNCYLVMMCQPVCHDKINHGVKYVSVHMTDFKSSLSYSNLNVVAWAKMAMMLIHVCVTDGTCVEVLAVNA